ncbi:MAG TPA: hypothetical protein VI390_06525, partial [Methyloceanibacter sp.]
PREHREVGEQQRTAETKIDRRYDLHGSRAFECSQLASRAAMDLLDLACAFRVRSFSGGASVPS